MERKIIQICAVRLPEMPQIRNDGAIVVALCNDGSIWQQEIDATCGSKWVELPAIPQPTEVKDGN